MIACYLREQQRYTFRELTAILKLNDTNTEAVLRKLKRCNIIKAVRVSDVQKDMTELAQEDILTEDVERDSPDQYYVTTFVGVILIHGRILNCYPKYLPANSRPAGKMRRVLSVLEKYVSRHEDIMEFTLEESEGVSDILSIMFSLLRDYHENGIYTNSRDRIETNGDGEILWDRTIHNSYAILNEGRPYYTELQTMRHITDEYDFFRRLHECVLTEISGELIRTDLPEMFDIAVVDLSEERIDDFGDKEYILERIEKELNVEFNTRKQWVLKTIHAYLRKDIRITNDRCFALFGSNSFNLVWEEVCREIFDDRLKDPLGSLHLPVPLRTGYDRKTKLIDIIEKPVWGNGEFSHLAKDTLIPDIVTVRRIGEEYHFIILDAKYYVARIEKDKPLSGQPGIESITKQYLYQLAYSRFISDHQFDRVWNCFLLPTDRDCVVNAGTASMPMLDALGLEKIRVCFLPAETAYTHYINVTKPDISDLLAK